MGQNVYPTPCIRNLVRYLVILILETGYKVLFVFHVQHTANKTEDNKKKYQ